MHEGNVSRLCRLENPTAKLNYIYFDHHNIDQYGPLCKFMHVHIRCAGHHGPMVQSGVWYTPLQHFLSFPLVSLCILMQKA